MLSLCRGFPQRLSEYLHSISLWRFSTYSASNRWEWKELKRFLPYKIVSAKVEVLEESMPKVLPKWLRPTMDRRHLAHTHKMMCVFSATTPLPLRSNRRVAGLLHTRFYLLTFWAGYVVPPPVCPWKVCWGVGQKYIDPILIPFQFEMNPVYSSGHALAGCLISVPDELVGRSGVVSKVCDWRTTSLSQSWTIARFMMCWKRYVEMSGASRGM